MSSFEDKRYDPFKRNPDRPAQDFRLNPLDVSFQPEQPKNQTNGSGARPGGLPSCFTETDMKDVKAHQWYALALRDAKNDHFEPEASSVNFQITSVWGSDVAAMLKSNTYVGLPAFGLCLGSVALNLAENPLAAGALALVGVAGGLANWAYTYLRSSDVVQRFNLHITREYDQALAGENFLECIARTAILFNNIRNMNPITGLAPDQTLLRTDSEETTVSYALRQIQKAGKYAYENRFGLQKGQDGSVEVVNQLKDQKFDQLLKDIKGLPMIEARWLRVPKFLGSVGQGAGALTGLIGAGSLIEAIGLLLR